MGVRFFYVLFYIIKANAFFTISEIEYYNKLIVPKGNAAALRNRRFLSLAELNEAISERLYEFNHKPFQKRDGSRAIAFEEEKAFLMPLPSTPFELSTWKIATVAPNYHMRR